MQRLASVRVSSPQMCGLFRLAVLAGSAPLFVSEQVVVKYDRRRMLCAADKFPIAGSVGILKDDARLLQAACIYGLT